jgi:hypothetical protein
MPGVSMQPGENIGPFYGSLSGGEIPAGALQRLGNCKAMKPSLTAVSCRVAIGCQLCSYDACWRFSRGFHSYDITDIFGAENIITTSVEL